MAESRVVFAFDERSLATLAEIASEAKQGFTEVVVRDPETQEKKVMIIPRRQSARIGGSIPS